MNPAITTTETPETYKDRKAELIRSFEFDYATAMLRKHNGNIEASSREAGVSVRNWRKLLKRNGIDANQYRPTKVAA